MRNAARLAVYEDTMINVKNHQTPAAILVDIPLKNGPFHTNKCSLRKNYMGAISEPCCIRLPIVNQSEFLILNWLTRNSGSSMHG